MWGAATPMITYVSEVGSAGAVLPGGALHYAVGALLHDNLPTCEL